MRPLMRMARPKAPRLKSTKTAAHFLLKISVHPLHQSTRAIGRPHPLRKIAQSKIHKSIWRTAHSTLRGKNRPTARIALLLVHCFNSKCPRPAS